MKHIFKKSVSLLLTLCMVLSTVAVGIVIGKVPGYALSNESGQQWIYPVWVTGTNIIAADNLVSGTSGTYTYDPAVGSYAIGASFPLSWSANAACAANGIDFFYRAYVNINGSYYSMSDNVITVDQNSQQYCVDGYTNNQTASGTYYITVPANGNTTTVTFTCYSRMWHNNGANLEASTKVTLNFTTSCSHTGHTSTQHNGSQHWTHCSVCGSNWGHTGHADRETGRTPATCASTGTVYHRCDTCGYEWTTGIAVAPSAHPQTSLVSTAAVPTTCEHVGYTAGVFCNNCNRYVSGHDQIAQLPHSYTGDYRINGDGTHSRQCVNGCGQYSNQAQCTYVSQQFLPSCTAEGYTADTCYVCGYQANPRDYTSMVAHEYEYQDQGDGTHAYQCKNCYTVNETAAHTYENHVCAYCGATETVPVTYLNDDGSVIATVPVIYESDAVYSGDTPESALRPDYAFAGWSGDPVNVIEPRTFAAQYRPAVRDAATGSRVTLPGSHTVRFFADAGNTDLLYTTYVADGDSAAFPAGLEPEKAGETFKGWDQPLANVCEDRDLHACFTKEGESVLATFQNNGGDFLANVVVPIGETAFYPNAAPTYADGVKDYTFSGWDHPTANMTADTVFTAQYEAVGDHMHVFNIPGGSDTQHWTQCACGTVDEATRASHALSYTVNNNGTHVAACETCGYEAMQACNYKVTEYPAGCQVGAYTGYVCKGCGYEYNTEPGTPLYVHTYTEYVRTVRPTCSTDGYTVYKCPTCERTEARDYVETRDPNNHSGAPEDFTDAPDLAPTCVLPGYTDAKVCPDCGQIAQKKEVPPTGEHTYTVYMEHVDATCIANGYDLYKCADCSATAHLNETADIDPANHVADAVITLNDVAPTCTTPGYTNAKRCGACGVFIQKTEVPATGEHSFTRLINFVPSTCTTYGYKVYQCTADPTCMETEIRERSTALNPNNHAGNIVLVNAVEATCEHPGYTGDEICDACEAVLTAGEEIPAAIHALVKVETVPGTCAAESYDIYRCDGCGAEEIRLNGLGKDPENHTGNTEIRGIVAPTATAEGYTGDTYCTDCGALLATGETIPVTHTHSYDNVIESAAATCVAAGYEVRRCICGDTQRVETEPLNPANHVGEVHVFGAMEATETQDGYTGDKVCGACNNLIEAGQVIQHTGSDDPDTPDNPDNPEESEEKGSFFASFWSLWQIILGFIRRIAAMFRG